MRRDAKEHIDIENGRNFLISDRLINLKTTYLPNRINTDEVWCVDIRIFWVHGQSSVRFESLIVIRHNPRRSKYIYRFGEDIVIY